MGLLDGRVCIVTGAGRGIGRDNAITLARKGAKVIVNDPGVGVDGTGHDGGPAEQVVAEIKAAGGDAVANFGNVGDWKQSEDLVNQAYEKWGRLDVMVNNAGILRDKIVWSMTEADWDAVMNVHMKGTFNCTRHATALWREQFKKTNKPLDARIINTVSGAMFGSTGQSNYGAAKSGIIGFTLCVALEVQSMGITCNAVRPGGMTRMNAAIPKTGDLADLVAKSKAQTAGTDAPKTWGAELIAYLASTASGFVSGQLLHVRDDRLELNKGWHVDRVLNNRKGEPWTAEQMVAGVPKMLGAGPSGLLDFLGV